MRREGIETVLPLVTVGNSHQSMGQGKLTKVLGLY